MADGDGHPTTATALEELPTPKAADMRRYHEHISYVLRHYETLARFYDITTAELRFQNYQGVQRAREEMANILISGGKKYNSSKRHNTRKNRKRRKKKGWINSKGKHGNQC